MKPTVLAAAALAAAGLGACFGLSGPPSGLLAISPILPAWPSVVEDDVLRDAEGAEAPLTVDVFDGQGNPVSDATVVYVVRDRGLHVDANGLVHGDSARTSPVRVLAQVRRGNDIIQTPEVNIDVVPLPDSLAPGGDTTFQAKPIPVTDPAPISSDAMTVKVLHRTGGSTPIPVRSWIVSYEILSQPAGVGGQNTALFSGSSTSVRAVADTTDGSGVASRSISLQRALLANSTGRQDVTVRATIRRVGTASETRAIVFTLPFGQ